MRTCFGASSTCRIFFFEKNENFNFWWYFKVPPTNYFWVDFDKSWQFWAVLGKFSYYGSGWQHACPHLKGKKEKVITFAKSVKILPVMACWKALRISHPPKKFQKIQLQIGIVVMCPKSQNPIYGTHSPLGIEGLLAIVWILAIKFPILSLSYHFVFLKFLMRAFFHFSLCTNSFVQ
jgi:hypothetical protein